MSVAEKTNAAALKAWRHRLKSTNINELSLLASDYLNHFNEVIMLIEMAPDMPECLAEAREWRPRSYKEHFADSAFSDREIAIVAYDRSPVEFRGELEKLVASMNKLVETSLARIEGAIDTGEKEVAESVVTRATRDMKRLVAVAGGIINGSQPTISQADIDNMFCD